MNQSRNTRFFDLVAQIQEAHEKQLDIDIEQICPDPILREQVLQAVSKATRSPFNIASNSARVAPPSTDRYLFRSFIAEGGMGAVWRAYDNVLNREVAIKVLKQLGNSVESFRREAELVSQLQHPSIVPIHDYGILLDGSAFFVMKLVEGRTLSELLSTRPTPEEELPRLVKIFEQICQGVAYAHFKKPERVLHRDLKPQNVMVGAFGEVMVMDWGIAKLLADRHESLDVSIRAKENRSNNELTSTVKKEPSTGGGEDTDDETGSLPG